MTEMKYYITYANWKPEHRGPEAFKKAMKEWTKTVEGWGLKIAFWGAALGVPEGALIVFKGSVEDYMKMTPIDAPYTNTRTNVVVVF
jgi:hypothetical protein